MGPGIRSEGVPWNVDTIDVIIFSVERDGVRGLGGKGIMNQADTKQYEYIQGFSHRPPLLY
jgi:hypothetical protein